MKRMWEIKNAVDSSLDLYIYNEVRAGYSYNWETDTIEKSKTSAEYFKDALNANPNIKQINIYINSTGGSVFEGTAIYNILKRHPAHKTVYVDGRAASIASVIAMAGDEVIMPRNTLMMVHNPWMYCEGNAKELRKFADDLDVIGETGRNAYLEKAGEKLTSEEITALMDAETWLSAERCIELGLADKYAEEDAPAELIKESLKTEEDTTRQRLKNLSMMNKEINDLFEIKSKTPEKSPEEKGNKTPVETEKNKIFEFFSKTKG